MTTDPLFRMTVSDVFTIRGRGIVVTGQVESGTVNVGDEISFERQGVFKKTAVTGIEMFRKQLKQAKAGDNVGLLLRDIDKPDIKQGDVLTGSGSQFSWNP